MKTDKAITVLERLRLLRSVQSDCEVFDDVDALDHALGIMRRMEKTKQPEEKPVYGVSPLRASYAAWKRGDTAGAPLRTTEVP